MNVVQRYLTSLRSATTIEKIMRSFRQPNLFTFCWFSPLDNVSSSVRVVRRRLYVLLDRYRYTRLHVVRRKRRNVHRLAYKITSPSISGSEKCTKTTPVVCRRLHKTSICPSAEWKCHVLERLQCTTSTSRPPSRLTWDNVFFFRNRNTTFSSRPLSRNDDILSVVASRLCQRVHSLHGIFALSFRLVMIVTISDDNLWGKWRLTTNSKYNF